MNWKILGIEETKDKNEITRAYRERLAVTNPEDKPEEFMELRNAYEEALRLADEINKEPDTPVKAWERKLEDLYGSFEKRNHIENWKELFSDPICTAFDTKDQIEDELINFLTRNYEFDTEIWKYLNSMYDFLGRREELKDKYPPEFVDYVLVYKQFYHNEVPYAYFYPGKDEEKCKEYLGYYFALARGEGDLEALMETLEQSPEKHPYGEVLLISRTDLPLEIKVERVKEIVDRYPGDSWLISTFANLCNASGNYKLCHQYCENYLKENPGDLDVIEHNVLAYLGEGNLEIMDYIRDLYINPDFSNLDYERVDKLHNQAATLIIEHCENKKKDQTLTANELLELARCYAGMEQFEKLEEIMPLLDRTVDYYKWARVCLASEIHKNNYDIVIQIVDEIIDYLKKSDQSVEINKKRLLGIGEMECQKVLTLYKKGEKEEAQKQLSEVFDKYKNDLRTVKNILKGAVNLRQSDLLEKCADILIEMKPDWYEGYLCKAYCAYVAADGRDGESLYWADYAIFLFGGDIEAYLLKIRLLINNDVLDQAEEIINMLENAGLEDNAEVKFCRGKFLEKSEKDDEAFELFESLYEIRENIGIGFNMRQEYLYRYLVQKEAHTDYNNREEIEKLLEIADEGLKLRPDHYGTMDYHAFIQLRLKNTDEALEEYLKITQMFQYYSVEIDERIAHIYYEDLGKNAEKALEFFEKVKDKDGEKFSDYYMGVCHYYLQDFLGAKFALEEIHEREPEDKDVLRWLAYTYMALNESDKALEIAEQLTEAVASESKDSSSKYTLYLRVLRRQGRFDEALESAKRFKENGNYNSYCRDTLEISLQAGKLEEAKALSYDYMENGNEDEAAVAIHTLLCCYVIEDNPEMVRKVYEENQSRFSYFADAINTLVWEYFGNHELIIENVQSRIRKNEQDGGDDFTYLYNQMAEFYYRAGNLIQAKKYAQLAVENADYILSKNTDIKTMIHSRKIQPLAVLGRYEEAEEIIQYCMTAPKCLSCEDIGCRDIDIFEAFMEETRGNFEKAYEICDKALKNYPGETDFAIYRKYFAKKIEEKSQDNK